jgi:hypothetical protein
MAGNQIEVCARSGSDARSGNDRDDPARRTAGLNFHDRTDQPGDGRSLHGHGCVLAAMLMIAAASRDFSIGRIKCLHVDQAAEGETVPQ